MALELMRLTMFSSAHSVADSCRRCDVARTGVEVAGPDVPLSDIGPNDEDGRKLRIATSDDVPHRWIRHR